jgi:hypothetical protein
MLKVRVLTLPEPIVLGEKDLENEGLPTWANTGLTLASRLRSNGNRSKNREILRSL